MNKRKITVKCSLLLLLCVILGGVFIAVANYIPINEHNKNVSLEEIGSEGLFPAIPSMQGGYGDFHSMNPTALELATDSLMLKMALYEGEDAGIIQAFRCYSTQYEEDYSRYWHGYVVVLRCLLLFFDYYEIRIINSFCQGILFIMTAVLVWKQKGIKYALALTTSYFLLMPMALGMCLQYSWVFYVTFWALLIYLRKRDYWEQGSRYIYFFLVVGAVTIYLDLLTYPLLTWGLLITWWILLQSNEETVVGNLKKVVFSGIAWIAGYGGMWIGKWLVGSIVLRENLFAKAISEALLWTVNEGDSAITLQDRFEAIYLNWSTYGYKLYFIVLVVWLLYWMIHGVLYKSNRSLKAPALLLIACSSMVWYVFLAGHAQMHHIFTHRIFGVSIAAFLGIILLSTENNILQAVTGKYICKYIVCVFAVVGLSVVSMFQLKDDYEKHNGTSGFVQYELDEAATVAFTPAYSNVSLMYIGVSAVDATEGYCLVQLMDRNTILDEIMLPIEKFQGSNFHRWEVDWNLETEHEYTLSIEPIDSNGTINIWVTSDEELPLPEFGKVLKGNLKLPGQMLVGITYRCVIMESSKRLLFTLTYSAVFMMIIYAGWSAIKPRFWSMQKEASL